MTTPQPDPPGQATPYLPAPALPYPPANGYPSIQVPAYPPMPAYPSMPMPAYLYPQPLVQVQRVDRNGIGTAGLVLGIIAAGFSLIPVVGVIAWGIWPVGLVLAWVGLQRSTNGEATNRSSAVAGLVLSGMAALICLAWVLVPLVYFTSYGITH